MYIFDYLAIVIPSFIILDIVSTLLHLGPIVHMMVVLPDSTFLNSVLNSKYDISSSFACFDPIWDHRINKKK